jgi:heat shock protein HslJ
MKQGLNGVGEVKVVTGCHILNGTYKIEDENIKISIKPLESNEKVCSAQTLEENFLEVLRQTVYWKIKGEELTFSDERDNELLKFKAIFF